MGNDFESANDGLIPVGRDHLNILVTDEDKHGHDIAKMSDFMGLYAQKQTTALATTTATEIILNLPIADLGIISDAVQQAAVLIKDDLTLIPDMEHIPADIKKKLKDGIYKIGESKQVDGNMRAVIVDESGTRVKDITLKEVANNPGNIETARSISNQLQMKQINDKLAAIQEIQSYQLDKQRDHEILVPFLNARDSILFAQNAQRIEDRNLYLQKASDELMKAKNAVYSEMKTASVHLAKKSKWAIFQRQSTIDTLTSHLSDDLQLSTKICGIQMQVLEYLGHPELSKLELEQYNHEMQLFLSEKVGNSGLSTIELIHDNFNYSKDNLDCWYTLSKEMSQAVQDTALKLDTNKTYVIGVED